MNTTEARDFYRDRFAQFEKDLNISQAWTRSVRGEAISRFSELGFPDTGYEEWKYTNVGPIAEIPFELAENRLNGVASEALARLGIGNLAENRLVFINGHYSPKLSSLRLPENIRVGNLAAVLSENPGGVEPYLARYASYQDQAFVALNTAWMNDGSFVYVPRGNVLREPIHLVFFSTAQGEATVSYPRNLIVIGDESQATVVETYLGVGNEVYFTNAVTEIVLGKNAVFDHYKLQRESDGAFHVATLQVHQDRSSNFSSHSISLGGALARNDFNSVLDGEGSECSLNGLYMVDGKQHVDNHTRVDHVKPHCNSRELYKGILDGKAKGVFNGKIYVHTAAQGTDAKQTNKNLLLSEDATINTKPQLEIYNDNVKCTHGSTVGQLDQDGLFYLRSRGIELKDARRLMTYAFASEIIGQIKVAKLRTWLEETFQSRI
jgi:Fe-S cluster assembly protein SufD